MLNNVPASVSVTCNGCDRDILPSDSAYLSVGVMLKGIDNRDYSKHEVLEDRLDFCSECMDDVWSRLWRKS